MELRTRTRPWNTPLRGKPMFPEPRPLPKIRGTSTRPSPLARGGSIGAPPQWDEHLRELRYQRGENSPLTRSPKRKTKPPVERPSFVLEMSHRKTLSTTVSTTADSVHLRSPLQSKDTPRLDTCGQEPHYDSRNVIQTPSSIRDPIDDLHMVLDDDLVSYYEHQLTPALVPPCRDTPNPLHSQTPDPRSLTMISFCRRSLLRKEFTRTSQPMEPEMSSTPPLGRTKHQSIAEAPLESGKNEAKTPSRPRKHLPPPPDTGRIYFVPPLRKGHRSHFSQLKKKTRRRSPF